MEMTVRQEERCLEIAPDRGAGPPRRPGDRAGRLDRAIEAALPLRLALDLVRGDVYGQLRHRRGHAGPAARCGTWAAPLTLRGVQAPGEEGAGRRGPRHRFVTVE